MRLSQLNSLLRVSRTATLFLILGLLLGSASASFSQNSREYSDEYKQQTIAKLTELLSEAISIVWAQGHIEKSSKSTLEIRRIVCVRLMTCSTLYKLMGDDKRYSSDKRSRMLFAGSVYEEVALNVAEPLKNDDFESLMRDVESGFGDLMKDEALATSTLSSCRSLTEERAVMKEMFELVGIDMPQ